MQQQQPQQNPGMGGLTFPNMSSQNTGLTPQFGSQIGGILRNGLGGIF